jgi:hypothetical protein
MLDIVMIDDEYIHMFAKRLAQFSRELGGQHYVSMVLRYCLLTDALCTLGHVIDRGCNTPVEHVEQCCKGRQTLFLIFLNNVPYA